ncbi:MAG: DUF2939 domain-containing protein [Acidobacteriota bacterium]|nr:DUF2939 domain-containing protein [Acidobacteriota bacterium]
MPATEATNRQTRSRIVIDINQQQGGRGGGGRKGGVRKILAFVALVAVAALAVLVVGSYVWWQGYKKSPAYSLALLVDAAQRDDRRTIDELIDSNRVAENFIPQIAGKIYGLEVAPAQAEKLRQQVEALAPQIVPGVRDQIRDEIARVVKEAAASIGDRMPFVLLALGVPRVASEIKEDGDVANVLFNLNNRPVELTMGRNGARWKIIAVKNDELAASIAARVAASLPPLLTPARRAPVPPPRPASTTPRSAPAATGQNNGGENQ